MEILETFLSYRGLKTYVKIANPRGKNIPLLCLHGGPGYTHNSLELLFPLAERSDRPVILYDQIGCGLSSLPDNHPDLYQKVFWIGELENLRQKLHLRRFHLLGHSWGGMLAQLYLTSKHRRGVVSVTLSSTLCSASQWREETHRLAKKLSQADQEVIENAETSGDYHNEPFHQVSQRYLKLTVSDFDKNDPRVPECLRREKRSGIVAYETAWGPSEFTPLGNLRNYDTRPSLNTIHCPALICYGSEDESTLLQNQTMYEKIGSKKKLLYEFRGARHMTYFEANEEYLNLLNGWLKENDPR